MMTDRCLCEDFELRGRSYEIWNNGGDRYLIDPHSQYVVDTDHDFDPPLSNDELLAIYDYGKGF
jgi:hypothetical protein